jgi:hypothetical protein
VEPLVSAIGRSRNGHCTANQLLGFFESFLESTDLPEAVRPGRLGRVCRLLLAALDGRRGFRLGEAPEVNE